MRRPYYTQKDGANSKGSSILENSTQSSFPRKRESKAWIGYLFPQGLPPLDRGCDEENGRRGRFVWNFPFDAV